MEYFLLFLGGVACIAIGALWATARASVKVKDAQEKETAARLQLESVASDRQVMEDRFKALASDIVAANSTAFLRQAGEQFKSLKEGSEQDLEGKKKLIDQSLSSMNERLNELQKNSVALAQGLETSHQATEALKSDTSRLCQILSSSEHRGQWGERMVDDILGLIGLVENVNYTRQEAIPDSGQRPDFTFILPEKQKLNMDVKFPLAHYERYLNAEDADIKKRECEAFLKNVRQHVRTLSGRDYINPEDGTLEYVMLFIPNESIYGFINSHDGDLIDFALQNRVLLCSPLTLYAVLSLIHQASRNFALNKRASAVLDLLAGFRKEWDKYAEKTETLGNSIRSVNRHFDEMSGVRTRQLQRQVDKIDGIPLTDDPEPEEKTGEITYKAP